MPESPACPLQSQTRADPQHLQNPLSHAGISERCLSAARSFVLTEARPVTLRCGGASAVESSLKQGLQGARFQGPSASSLRAPVLSRTLCCDLCLADSFEAYRLFQYTGQLVTVLCETCALHVTHAAPSKRSSLMIRALLPRSAGNLLCKGRGVLRFLGCAKIGSFLEPAASHFCVLPDVCLEGATQKQNKNFSQLERRQA